MAEVVGGISGLTRKYLPVPQAADVGKYLKVDTNGNPVYYAETPGGVVTEAGANAANSIGADSGADIGTKLANVINNASTTQKGVALLGASDGAAKLIAMPDANAAVYSNDDFTSTTGLLFSSCDHAESSGVMTLTPTAISGRLRYNGTIGSKTLLVK